MVPSGTQAPEIALGGKGPKTSYTGHSHTRVTVKDTMWVLGYTTTVWCWLAFSSYEVVTHRQVCSELFCF